MIKSLKDKLIYNNKNKMDTNGKIKITPNIKMIVDNFTKFKLLNKSKFPSEEWAKKNKYKWSKTKHKHGNWGLPTGKINNIIGFDPDYYKWPKDHAFYTEFLKGKTWPEYIKEVNTLTTKTPNGGLHFIFTYNELPQINCPKNEIDIKSDGGYLVGPGSKVLKNDGSMGEYVIINQAEIKDMPQDLYNWLYNNLNYKHNKKQVKLTKEQKEETIKNPDKIGYYTYDFTNAEVIYILDNLPVEYITKHETWFITATAMKSINKVDLFLQYCINHKDTKCKSKGDQYYNINVKLINGITQHNNLKMINHLLLICKIKGARTMLDYVKYKPIFTGKYKTKPSNINVEKLGHGMELERNKNYVIKSDTGTGKTTIAKNYLLKTKQKLISIVSRISLGDAQYNTFNEAGINVSNYRLIEDRAIEDGENIIITIDSIKRLNRLNYSNYVCFLDEYNSLIEYLITCPNLKDKRVICFKILLQILKECKQIVAVDADIHPATLLLLDYVNKPYTFINNEYQHNKKNNVKSSEIFNYNQFTQQLVKEKQALICCDSKNESEVIFNDYVNYHINTLGAVIESQEKSDTDHTENKFQKYIITLKYKDNSIKKCALITSDTDEIVDLDEFDIVVFSPKIIYGLDSQLKRPVYAHYKEHTISPKAMLQQLCRCRNITYLKYIFYKKEFKTEKYQTLKQVEKETQQLEELAIFELMCSVEEAELYNKMFNIITYNEDAYNTNKFGHFKHGLRCKGFTDRTDYYQTSKETIKDRAKENKQEKYDNFSSENPIYEKINEYLDLPKELWADHKELFIEQADLNKHFNIQNYFFKGEATWKQQLVEQEEFNAQKVRSNKNKYIYIKAFLEKLGINNKTDFNIKKGFSKEEGKTMYKNYKLIFRDRGKKELDLTIPNECEKLITRIYKKEFGSNIVEGSRVNIGGKKVMTYNFNYDCIYKHRDISKYKYTELKEGKLDFTFNKENELYNSILDGDLFLDDE